MHVDAAFITLAVLVLLALGFDFMNGFHDAANSIATVVSTRVLKPYQAVVWAAVFNFVAIWLFEPRVAATIGKGIVSPEFVDNAVIFGALIGAITWNIITWYFGIPSSSSHALIGGMIGAAMAKAGVAPLVAPGIIRTAIFIFVSPVLGFVIGGGYMAISIGTLCGGWRIIRTMGQKLTKLTPASGSAASAGGAITLFIASHAGIPVSTTHTITGAILGTGAVQNPSRVRWGLATSLVYAWLLTIPASALVAALAWWVGSHLIPQGI